MGLYGMVVVTAAPPSAGAAGTAYPNVTYNAEVPLLFSEIDPVQNQGGQRRGHHCGVQRDQRLVRPAGRMR